MQLAVPKGTGRDLRAWGQERGVGNWELGLGIGKRETGRKKRGGNEVKEGWDGAMGGPTHVTQMVKQSAEPIKAIMLSKAGKTIDMARNIRIVTIRTATFAMPLK